MRPLHWTRTGFVIIVVAFIVGGIISRAFSL